MKKTVFITIILLICGISIAQVPTRDTIVGREVTYLYPNVWIDPFDSVLPNGFNCESPHSNVFLSPLIGPQIDEYALRYYTDEPLTIIGLATCAENNPNLGNGIHFLDTVETHTTEYLRLYIHVHDTMIMIREEPFNMVDTSRWMHFCTYWDSHLVMPVIERYFSDPVDITDSFYVAATQYTLDTWSPGTRSYESIPIFYWAFTQPMFNPSYACRGSIEGQELRWRFGTIDHLPFLFPIFDTTGMGLGPHNPECEEVENLHTVWAQNGSALFMWDWDAMSNAINWQLAVGRASEPADSYRVHEVYNTYRILDGLDSNVRYAARVRAHCEGNDNYGPWSDTIQFMIGSDEQHEGTEGVVGRFSYLVPNPAHGSVMVASSFTVNRVEIFDMSGTKVMEQEANSLSTTLDISALPAGLYIVAIHTPHGIATKKLTVL